MEKPINQCDGCRRGLPVKNGLHHDPKRLLDGQGCTRKLYEVLDLTNQGFEHHRKDDTKAT